MEGILVENLDLPVNWNKKNAPKLFQFLNIMEMLISWKKYS